MEHDLQLTISLLSRTPGALKVLLSDLPEDWTGRNEGDGTWTGFDIVAHLNHCERVDWMVRVKAILQSGEKWPFQPVDRAAAKSEARRGSIEEALDEFARLRAQNLSELRALNLQEEDMARRGAHPVFGPVTLSQLLATWATHDLTHLHQLSRVMAHQYRDAVGPWIAYLGVLQCTGHSAP